MGVVTDSSRLEFLLAEALVFGENNAVHLVRRIATRPFVFDGLNLEASMLQLTDQHLLGNAVPAPVLGTPSGIVDPSLGSSSTIANRPPCFSDRNRLKSISLGFVKW